VNALWWSSWWGKFVVVQETIEVVLVGGKGDCSVVYGHGSRRNDEDNNIESDTSVRSGRKAGKKGKCYNCGICEHCSFKCHNLKKERKKEAFFASAHEHLALLWWRLKIPSLGVIVSLNVILSWCDLHTCCLHNVVLIAHIGYDLVVCE
jgi:hypothetical protein